MNRLLQTPQVAVRHSVQMPVALIGVGLEQ
jgi:hypothetical protein